MEKISRDTMLDIAQKKAEQTKARYVNKESVHELIESDAYWQVSGTNTTVCCLILKNGFTVTEHAACIDDKLFDPELGRKYAYSKAVDKLYQLLAFHYLESDR